MSAHEHPFDGGPAYPCTDENTERCGISVRAVLFAHVISGAAFALDGHGEFRLTPEQVAARGLAVTDAGLDALEIKP
jgi:hypothetical protein